MKTELEHIEKMVPAKLFKPNAMDKLLIAIETEVTSVVPDVDTPAGRDAIKSLAYKIARSKTTIDDIGKEFVGKQKAAIAEIDGVRKTSRDFLDCLKVKVRIPLTDWENAEEERIRKIQLKVDTIKWLGDPTDDVNAFLPAATLLANQEKLKAMKITKVYAEYQDTAINAKNESIVALIDAIPAQETREREAAENDRRRLEEEENQRIENEQRIAREAVEAADSEAQRELDQIKETEAREAGEKAARERSTKHKGNINRAAADAISVVTADLELAKAIVAAIAKGKIPNVTINY